MQIIARAIYPYSELKTVRYLRENTALAEMFGIPKEKITKDALYESAKRLWDEHRGLEDWLHDRVCSMFGIEEKILPLMVDSDVKGAKERSMYEQACKRYEEGLEAIKKGILTKGGTKKRDAVNKRLGKLDKQYGAIRLSYNVTFTYEGIGKNEVATSMTWECREDKAAQRRKFHGKYVLLTSLDESQELNIWKFYNVIRTVEETFHVLKTDLDIRPVYHKTDNGIKSHLNLAILAYWVVCVTKYRLKLKKHENVRWDEIMRIASTQVVVTAKVETVDGQVISIRQSTEAESKLSAIYDLLYINPKPLGKRKSMLHPNQTSKNPDIGNQGVT